MSGRFQTHVKPTNPPPFTPSSPFLPPTTPACNSGLEQYHKRAEQSRVGIADSQFSRLLEASWIDLARSPLAGHIKAPNAVLESDLIRLVWRHQGARRREGGISVGELLHLVMSPQVRCME